MCLYKWTHDSINLVIGGSVVGLISLSIYKGHDAAGTCAHFPPVSPLLPLVGGTLTATARSIQSHLSRENKNRLEPTSLLVLFESFSQTTTLILSMSAQF